MEKYGQARTLLQPGITIAAFFLVLTVLLAPGGSAQARRWMVGDNRRWQVLRACKDGALFEVLFDQSWAPDFDPSKFQATVFRLDLSARLFANPDAAPPDVSTGHLGSPSGDYGPLIAPTNLFTMRYHNFPLTVDTGNSGAKDYHMYTSGMVRWSPDLTPGVDRVMLVEDSVNVGSLDPVEDCRVDQLSFSPSGVTSISSNLLPSGGTAWQPGIYYTLAAAPAAGDVLLNGQTLPVGGQFSPDDLAADHLAYQKTVAGPYSDRLRFSLHGVLHTTRLTELWNGVQANADSSGVSISADGTKIAFASKASNLVLDDTVVGCDINSDGIKNENCMDIFVRDLIADEITLISESKDGVHGNGNSFDPSISPDGSMVAFSSDANNFVGGGTICEQKYDTNVYSDIYIKTLASYEMHRFSVSSTRSGYCDHGNGNSDAPVISAASAGPMVAFVSDANDLLKQDGGTDANGLSDVFTHGLYGGGTTRVASANLDSLVVSGNSFSLPPSISADGQAVAFPSFASDLVAGDVNGNQDVFVRQNDRTILVSSAPGGLPSDGNAYDQSISATGRFVVFTSDASNLVTGAYNGWPQVYVYDRDADGNGIFDEPGTATTSLVSIANDGSLGNGESSTPSISADGRLVVYMSIANNLVAGDANGVADIFIRDRDVDGNGVFDEAGGTLTARLSVGWDGSEANSWSAGPKISSDGKSVVFGSNAGNLVPFDTNNVEDIFLVTLDTPLSFPLVFGPGWSAYLPMTYK